MTWYALLGAAIATHMLGIGLLANGHKIDDDSMVIRGAIVSILSAFLFYQAGAL